MKRILFTLLVGACLAATNSVAAMSLWDGCLDIDVQSGWRQDRLDFSVTNKNVSPNTKQTRKWENIRSYDSFGRIDYEWCNILLRGYGNYGKIYVGHSRTKSYSGSTLINDQKAEADRGEVFDYGVAIGYRFPLCYCDQHFVITPLLGWSQHEQHLRQTHGQDLLGAGIGAISPMHNSYQTRWYGPWLGYNLSYSLPCNFSIHHMFEWHWARYRARGSDFERAATNANAVRAKYRHRDHGSGYLVGGGMEYAINQCWCLGVNSYYMSMDCRNGKENASSTLPVVGSTSSKLNSVDWHNWVVRAEIDYCF